MVLAEEIKYECEIQENISVADLRNAYKDGIIVWMNGSATSVDGKSAKYRCVIDYWGQVKYLEKEFFETTVNQAMIKGVIDAVMCVNKPFRIYLVTPSALGFASAFKGKGTNVELLQQLFERIKEKGITLTEVQYMTGKEEMKKFIYSCNIGGSKIKKDKKQQENKNNKYKEIVYRECLTKVEKILVSKGVEHSVVEEIRKLRP